MKPELVPFSGPGEASLLQRWEAKALGRSLAAVERAKTVQLARIEAEAETQAAVAHAVGYVGQQAMQAVTMVSQMEGQLGQACPLAVTRLQGIADMTAMSILQVVADSARRIG